MSIFNKMLNIGVSKEASGKEKKRIKILNLAAYISIAHAVFFLGFDYFTDTLDVVKAISLCLEIVVFSSILYIHYLGYPMLSRLIFTLVVFAVLFHHCNYAFKGYYGEYQYIIIPLFSLFYFEKKYVHYSLLILSIIAFYIPNTYYNIYPDKYFGYLNVLFIFLGLFFFVNYFKTLNDRNEKLLELEKNKVYQDKIILEKQQKELNKLNDFKSHFFVNISHEIRTPITLIKGYASRINTTEGDINSLESLNIIKKQTQNIQDIVNDILDLSKLEANELEINKEAVDVESFIKNIQVDFNNVFQKKEISFEIHVVSALGTIKIDESLFRKSINNLLNNALKFTPKKGQVILKIKLNNDKLEISVIDNGIGVPKEDIEKVFDRFYQSKNNITKSQGSGIGLAFTKSIIEAHGFELKLSSVPNKETRFTIVIPSSCFTFFNNIELSQEQLTNTVSDRNPTLIKDYEHNTINKKVLIVEDHDEMRDYLKLILKDYIIVEARNGEEGLRTIKKHEYNFDCIITDYMMPVMDGITFVNELKNQSVKIPIIVITARNDDKGKLNILRLGIDAYIAKPFLEEELLFNVKKAIFFYDEIRRFKNKTPDNEKLYLTDKELLFNDELKAIIESNYQNKNFGVDDIADELQLSRSSLFRKSKLFLGQTPNEVISEVRFQKAKELLEINPKIKKKDLADTVGVYNATYFYKKLNERFGVKK